MLSIESGDFLDAVEESTAILKTERAAIERDSRLLELMQRERELQEQEVARIKKTRAGFTGIKIKLSIRHYKPYIDNKQKRRVSNTVWIQLDLV